MRRGLDRKLIRKGHVLIFLTFLYARFFLTLFIIITHNEYITIGPRTPHGLPRLENSGFTIPACDL